MQRDGARYLSWAMPAAPRQLPAAAQAAGLACPAMVIGPQHPSLEAPRPLGKLGASFTWADSPPRDPS